METKRNTSITPFLDKDGRIKQWPVHNRTRIPVLGYLCGKFEKDRTYTEKEVNVVIQQWHTFGDYFLLRRSLIDYKFMERTPNGAQYWVINKEEQDDQQWTDEGNSSGNTR